MNKLFPLQVFMVSLICIVNCLLTKEYIRELEFCSYTKISTMKTNEVLEKCKNIIYPHIIIFTNNGEM